MTELRSTATVATDRSERWMKRLAAHLGRKAEVREEALTRGEHVVGSHLARFAQAEGLAVSWERGA